MNIWTDYTQMPLPELLSFVVDNRGKTVPLSNSGTRKLIATNCIRNENLYPVYEKIRWLSEETYNTWFRSHPLPGDIIFVCKGTPGRTCIVPNPVDFCIAQDMIALRVNQKIVYNRYLLAVLRSRHLQLQIANTSVGDVIPHFKKQFLDQLMIPIPPLETQKKIGDFYFAFSLLIENNKKINDNLQQQAMALFRAWFVEHSPFSGHLPLDWREYKLSDFLPVITGKQNANIASNQGKYPFFSCSQDIAWTNDYSFEGDAILVAGNGDFNVKFYSGKFEAYQRTYVLIPYNPRFAAWLYYAVKYNLNKITIGARGSVIRFITKGNLEGFTFYAPSNLDDCTIIDSFTAINKKIAMTRAENLKLAALRDTLLPRLMSGEIDVSAVPL